MNTVQQNHRQPAMTYVARAPRLGERKTGARPKQRSTPPNLFEAFAVLLFGSSLAAALGLTAYLMAYSAAPEIAARFVNINNEMFQNLAAGAAFFWLELCAIVLGIRLYENEKIKNLDYRTSILQLNALELSTYILIENIYDHNYKFAVALDASHEKSGKYDTNFAFLEKHIHFKISEFLSRLAIDGASTPEVRPLVERIATVLNRMYQDCYWAVDDAIKAYRTGNTEMLELALDRIFEACDPAERTVESGVPSDCLISVFRGIGKVRGAMQRPLLYTLFFPRSA
jgi:hypothetical protein